jgi:hypothetical protein
MHLSAFGMVGHLKELGTVQQEKQGFTSILFNQAGTTVEGN